MNKLLNKGLTKNTPHTIWTVKYALVTWISGRVTTLHAAGNVKLAPTIGENEPEDPNHPKRSQV